MNVKKGDTIEFNFHCAGLISKEKTTVTDIGVNYIQIEDGAPEYRFDKKTGKCLNDKTDFGAYRTLPKKYLTKG